jgi:hypothetical protein
MLAEIRTLVADVASLRGTRYDPSLGSHFDLLA